ncbi:MAG: hypothetical protein ACRC42_01260 [Mycoplasma sp.]
MKKPFITANKKLASKLTRLGYQGWRIVNMLEGFEIITYVFDDTRKLRADVYSNKDEVE